MHYIINNFLIKSENAASSTSHTNANILAHISSLSNGITALDYGCGKCRYSKQLNEKTEQLVLVDSEIQISRKQRIHGEKTTVKEFADSRLRNAKVYDLNDEAWKKQRYDFILCTNVLSAIPKVRERYTILHNIAQLLTENGTSLISVQFRNSYFSSYDLSPVAQKYEDGWIIKRGNSYTFYGIILPDKLVDMCLKSGLSIVTQSQKDGSVYLLVCKDKC